MDKMDRAMNAPPQPTPTMANLLDHLDRLTDFAESVEREAGIVADALGGAVPTAAGKPEQGPVGPAMVNTLARRVESLEGSMHRIHNHLLRAADDLGIRHALEQTNAPQPGSLSSRR